MNNPLAGTDPTGYCTASRIAATCANTPVSWGGSMEDVKAQNQLATQKLNYVSGAAAHASVSGATPQQVGLVKQLATDIINAGGLSQLAAKFDGSAGKNRSTIEGDSYLVSRPLDSVVFSPVLAHMFIVTNATNIGDENANIISFGELENGKTGNVGPDSFPSDLSKTTYESDTRFWQSLRGDQNQAELMTTRIPASSKTVREFARRLKSDTEYQMIGTLFDSTTNSNAAAYAVAYRAAWKDNNKLTGIPLPDSYRSKTSALHWKYINFKGKIDSEVMLNQLIDARSN